MLYGKIYLVQIVLYNNMKIKSNSIYVQQNDYEKGGKLLNWSFNSW